MSESKRRRIATPIEIVVVIVVICLLSIDVPINRSFNLARQKQNASAAKAHYLENAMYQYSVDHDGNYPSGPTSTIIFQKLYDGKYLDQPSDVYLAMTGKVLYPNQDVKGLQTENVSWDVVEHADGTGLNSNKDPGEVPVVVSTGLGAYTFTDGSNPVKITHPDQAAWGQDGVTIANLNQQASFIRPTSASDATVKLTELDFKTGTGTYKTVQP